MRIDISIDNRGNSKATFIYLINGCKCAIVELVEFIDSAYVYVNDFDRSYKKESFTNRNLAKAYVYECIQSMVSEN